MNRHVCFCSLHKPLLIISSAVKKTLFSMVKYVVVQDLVFLLVWMLALATTMSRFLYPDGRRHSEARSPETEKAFSRQKFDKRARCNFCLMWYSYLVVLNIQRQELQHGYSSAPSEGEGKICFKGLCHAICYLLISYTCLHSVTHQ